jgi:hypothetical protein
MSDLEEENIELVSTELEKEQEGLPGVILILNLYSLCNEVACTLFVYLHLLHYWDLPTEVFQR